MTISLALAAALAALQPAALPQDAAAAPIGSSPWAAAGAAEASGQRAVKRIIVLKSGGVMRGLARATRDGAFAVKHDGAWLDVPADQIERVSLESKLLREHKKRQKDTSLSPADRVEWALENGLLREAFTMGDRLLAEHPRDLDLRGVCARGSSRLGGLPPRDASGAFDTLRMLGAKAGPMIREGLIERVMTSAPRKELLAGFMGDLRSRQAGRRSFAVFCMGRLFPEEDPRAVLLHAIYDPSKTVRETAGRAIGDLGAATVGTPLVNGLYSKSAQVRVRSAEALGNAQAKEYVKPLIDRLYAIAAAPPGGAIGRPPHGYIFVGTQSAYVQDFDVEVARGSSVADPVINTLMTGSVLDVGVINTSEVTIVAEAGAVRGALKRIVGQAPGRRTKDWKKWWESEASAPYRDLTADPQSLER